MQFIALPCDTTDLLSSFATALHDYRPCNSMAHHAQVLLMIGVGSVFVMRCELCAM